MDIFDTIIVGAGSAGCVLAHRLGAVPGHRVLVLEAGGSDRSVVIAMPAATDLYAVGKLRWDWCLRAEPDPTLNGRADLWPRGKALGGSSSINGMIYVRGQREDYDGWAAAGATGWGYADVLPAFKRSEDNNRFDDAWHGRGGPLAVQDLRSPHPLAQDFIAACMESGVPRNDDINGATQFGAGPLQSTQRDGWRESTSRAFLRPAVARGNVSLHTHAQVMRVLFEGRRAVGVEYRRGGQVERAMARVEVILAGGALMSPQLLMHSGIGPAEQLQAQGIQVLQHSPGVGQNLQEHVGAFVSVQVNVPTFNDENAWPRRLLHGANWLFRGRGPGTTPGAHALAFIKTDAAQSRPDVQLHFTPAGYKLDGHEVHIFDRSAMMIVPNVCRPRSRSSLSLRSADPLQALAIHSRLIDDADDLRRLRAGLRFVRRLLTAPSMARRVVAEIAPGPEVHSDADWAAYVRQAAIPLYHPCGTCRMGSDADAVVGPRLQVRGTQGLRVVDASVMPLIPSGNTNAPTIMVAERAAEFMLEDRRKA